MRRTAELAERLDVRLHTHLAENSEDDEFALATFGMRPVDLYEDVGWMSDRTWGAHVVRPNPDEIGPPRRGRRRCRPLSEFQHDSLVRDRSGDRPARRRVSRSVWDATARLRPTRRSLWQEARLSMLQGKLVSGAAAMTARDRARSGDSRRGRVPRP